VQFNIRQLLIYGIMIFWRIWCRSCSCCSCRRICARKCSPPNSANK